MTEFSLTHRQSVATTPLTPIPCLENGTWRSSVAHLLWEQGVGSSNLPVPTKYRQVRGCFLTVLVVYSNGKNRTGAPQKRPPDEKTRERATNRWALQRCVPRNRHKGRSWLVPLPGWVHGAFRTRPTVRSGTHKGAERFVRSGLPQCGGQAEEQPVVPGASQAVALRVR